MDAAPIASQNPPMARKAKTRTETDGGKRSRRSPEQLIADLEKKIEEVKQRAAAKEAMKSGEGKALLGAVKALDRVLANSAGDTRRAVESARAILAERLAELGLGAASGGERVRRSAEDLDALAASVHAEVQSNPGLRVEEISAAIGVPSKELKRPVQMLLADGKLRTEGQKRGTQYFAAGSGAGRSEGKRSSKKRRTRR